MSPPSNFDSQLVSLIRRAKLKFPDAAKEDLLNVLNNFKDLQPDVVNFTFPDTGVNRNSLTLSGTVPIHYKGGKYNIPVALYFLDNHPYSGPYCYVKPTTNMRIRQSKTVDISGRIYLPYLTDWQYPSHDTPGLIQVMILSFQDKCPVYSVGPSATPTTTNHSSHNNSPPYPPIINSSGTNAPPPIPPYPGAAASSTPYPNSTPPPYPTSDPPPHLMPQPNVPGMGTATTGYPPPAHFQPTPYPSDPCPAVPSPPIPPPSSLGSGYGYSTGTIQQTHIRASLVSAVEDRIRQKLRDKISTPFAELESIEANVRELQSGKQQLQRMMDNIARDRAELDRILAIYTSKKEELERALATANPNGAENGTTLNVEDAIDAQTPVHKQILRCYAQDCAIDDTIYCLGQQLKYGTVNLQSYLKYVRQLSRQQFQHRHLMQKCRERARLPV